MLEKKPNILYLNTCIRGYPKELRAGSDPRTPIISVDQHFQNIDSKGIAAGLMTIEVWGCGDKDSREVQLDIKKWQIKEAERQRTVKLTAADWMDHPDRYLNWEVVKIIIIKLLYYNLSLLMMIMIAIVK